jgi:hypothetical protein
VNSICEEAKKWPQLKDRSANVSESLGRLLKAVKMDNALITGAREFAFSLYRIFAGEGIFCFVFNLIIKFNYTLLTASLIIERCIKTNVKETDLFLLDK